MSPSVGLCFIKAFSENSGSFTAAEDRFWTVDGTRVKSGIQKFRNYAHKIKSKLDDPIIEFTRKIPVHIVYVFPYVLKSIFENLHIKDEEKLLFGDEINLTLPLLEEPLDETNYSLLVSIIQNASIINKTSNIYVDEPAKNMFEAIELNNKKIAQFDYDQMAASLTITDKSERIRGLAGSGKTVLLAMKAARLHIRSRTP